MASPKRNTRTAALVALVSLCIARTAVCIAGTDRLEDPTRPPNLGDGAVAVEAYPEPVEEFRLTTILRARGRVIAVINGRRVQVGETINGAKVVDILPDHVVLDGDDGPVELRFTTSLKLAPKDGPSPREEPQ